MGAFTAKVVEMRFWVALLLWPSLAAAESAAPQFSDEQKVALERGEVLIKRVKPKDDKGVAAKAVAVVKAHPDQVWQAVNDCAHFKDFMPRTPKSEVKEDGKVCRVEVEMPFPFSNLWSETHVTQTFLDGGGRQRSWTLKEGTYEHLRGSWTVLPWGPTGSQTLLMYLIDANPNVPLPDAILRSAQEGTLPDLFTAIRQRVIQP